MPEYPGRQPAFYNWDMRIAKDFNFRERYVLRFSADLFNITNSSNLYSDPDVFGFVGSHEQAAASRESDAVCKHRLPFANSHTDAAQHPGISHRR